MRPHTGIFQVAAHVCSQTGFFVNQPLDHHIPWFAGGIAQQANKFIIVIQGVNGRRRNLRGRAG